VEETGDIVGALDAVGEQGERAVGVGPGPFVALSFFGEVELFAAGEVAGAELERFEECKCVLAGDGDVLGHGGRDDAKGGVRGSDGNGSEADGGQEDEPLVVSGQVGILGSCHIVWGARGSKVVPSTSLGFIAEIDGNETARGRVEFFFLVVFAELSSLVCMTT
jgi:hypothetical protein